MVKLVVHGFKDHQALRAIFIHGLGLARALAQLRPQSGRTL